MSRDAHPVFREMICGGDPSAGALYEWRERGRSSTYLGVLSGEERQEAGFLGSGMKPVPEDTYEASEHPSRVSPRAFLRQWDTREGE